MVVPRNVKVSALLAIVPCTSGGGGRGSANLRSFAELLCEVQLLICKEKSR